MISKTMRTILHALSYGNIEVEASQKTGRYQEAGCDADICENIGYERFIMETMKCRAALFPGGGGDERQSL